MDNKKKSDKVEKKYPDNLFPPRKKATKKKGNRKVGRNRK
jgi:hypothetical protein